MSASRQDQAKCILVTGAGSGLGRAAALQLARHGNRVIAAVYEPAQVSAVEAEAASEGIALRAEKLDLTSSEDREAAATWDVDVLVNNAAIGEGGPIAEIPIELVRQVFEVNVFATLALTQGIVKRMVGRGSGRVIFVSSIAGLTAGAYLGAYASSKHALEGIAEAMSNELAPHGIQVATLNPGPFGTGFNDQMIAGMRRWYDPSRNFSRPEDLATLGERFEQQFDPDELLHAMVELIESDSGLYRNVHPKASEELVRGRERDAWTRRQAPLGPRG